MAMPSFVSVNCVQECLIDLLNATLAENSRKADVKMALAQWRDRIRLALAPMIQERGWILGPLHRPFVFPACYDITNLNNLQKVVPVILPDKRGRLYAREIIRTRITDASLAHAIRATDASTIVNHLRATYDTAVIDPAHNVVFVNACWDQKETAAVCVTFVHPKDIPGADSPDYATYSQILDTTPPATPQTENKRAQSPTNEEDAEPARKKHKK